MTSGEGSEAWVEAAELNNRGLALAREGRFGEAIGAYRRAVEVSRGAGHRKALATALDNLSATIAWTGRIEEGLAAHEEALAIFQDLGDVDAQSVALSNLAAIHTRAGRPQAAVAAQRQAIEVARTAGDRKAEAMAHSHLGQILAADGNETGAVQAHRDAVAICRELGDREAEARETQTLAARLAEAGQFTAARETAEGAAAIFRDIGRHADAATLKQWLEYLPAGGGRRAPGYREWTTAPQPVSLWGCLPFLAAIGAIVAFQQEASWFLVGALAAVAILGWGTCLTSLVSLVAGVIILWKYNDGTWWLVGGLALLVFGVSSLRPRITKTRTEAWLGVSTPLDTHGEGSGGQEDRGV